MHLTALTRCGTASCPTVYRANGVDGGGTVVVQGRPIAPAVAGVMVAADEALVAIPDRVLLMGALRLLAAKARGAASRRARRA